MNFTLQVGALAEAVNVQAETPLIQTETSSLGNVIGSRQSTDLPLNGRDYAQLATLTAGVAKITEMAAASMARRQPRMETRAGVSR